MSGFEILDELPQLCDPKHFEVYVVSGRQNVTAELEALQSTKKSVQAIVFNDGYDAIATRIVGMDDDNRIVLEGSSDEEVNKMLETVPSPYFIGLGSSTNIQFAIERIECCGVEVEENAPRLRISLPDSLLRLPRRENYRTHLPSSMPLKFFIPVRQGGKAVRLGVDVVNISVGGLCFVVPKGYCFAKDEEYPGCVLELPGVGKPVVTLRVRQQFEVHRRNTGLHLRVGASFVGVDLRTEEMLQRFIIAVDIARKAAQNDIADFSRYARK